MTLLLLSPEGERHVTNFSLSSGQLSSRQDVDATTLRLDDVNKSFALSDGSVITVEPAGIVRKTTGTNALLVATPVAAFGKTPLAVWNDGARVAWVNPADRSLQVFERNSRGTYLPLYLNKDMRANSLGFTDDGSVLVAAKLGSENTELVAVDLATGTASSAGIVEGHAAIVSSL